MHRSFHRICFLALICLFIFQSGCEKPSTIGTPNPISIVPAKSAIRTGQSIRCRVNGGYTAVSWSLAASAAGGPVTAAAAGTIDALGVYTAPPQGSQSLFVTITATSLADPSVSATATVNVVAPGNFSSTQNPQVAQYQIAPAAPATVSVQFGPTTAYGFTTWAQSTPSAGGPVALYVAGMKADAAYHMRGVVQFADGTRFADSDQTFKTSPVLLANVPNLTVTTPAGIAPQKGVELLDLLQDDNFTSAPDVAVTDLAGNLLWAYNPSTSPVVVNPVKLLPNGHFMINYTSDTASVPNGTGSVMQEVDLAGNLIWQMTAAQLNQKLAAATCTGCNIAVVGTHHDFTLLPSGHLIVIAATQEVISGVTVTGDVLIDLDQNRNPVWLWNEFDHLDTSRRPYLYPDWTHTNAVLYSPDDGNLIVSIRHQNWLVKVDYDNGNGTGNILWHLGYQGDFTLLDSTGAVDANPFDWFYAQHGPSFVTPNTTGNFGLALFDNGDDRGVSVVTGGTCGVAGQPACYSTVPIFNIDESAMTATLTFNPTAPDYSYFGGNAEVLANGDVEFDECGITPLPANNAAVYEVTPTSPPQTVWQMQIDGQYAYRGMRLPSLYPGVEW
jgi:arylsulfate sulfotransferase